MKISTAKTGVFLAAMVAATVTAALAAPHTPKPGSSERAALMNALRKTLGGGHHKPIITPNHLKVERGWAYISGGFNYQNAPLEPRWQEGSGTNFSALLQQKGKIWSVKRRVYNGDVVVPDFIRDFPAAPRAIFR